MSYYCCPPAWDQHFESQITYEGRLAVPFVGPLGWVAFGLEAIVGIWFFVMLINQTSMNPYIILGWLIALGIVMFIFWGVNAARFAPYTQLDPTTGILMVKEKNTVWAVKLMKEAQFSNDQSHFQGALFRILAMLVFTGLFVGLNSQGTDAYSPLPVVYSDIATTNSIIAHILTALTIGAVTMAFSLNLLDTHWDFSVRQFTAFHNGYFADTGKTLPLASGPQSSSTGSSKGGTSLLRQKA